MSVNHAKALTCDGKGGYWDSAGVPLVPRGNRRQITELTCGSLLSSATPARVAVTGVRGQNTEVMLSESGPNLVGIG